MIKDKSIGIIPFHINSQDKVEYLVIKHKKGHWAFPKGHAEESDDNDQETAKREFYEETGLTATIIHPEQTFVEEYIFANKKKQRVTKEVIFYLGLVDPTSEIKIQEVEVTDAKWMTYYKAKAKITFPAGKKLIDQANSFITSHLVEITDAQNQKS